MTVGWIASCIGIAIALGLAWLICGRWIARLVDGCWRRRVGELKTDRFLIQDGVIVLGERRWPFATSAVEGLTIEADRAGRVAMGLKGRSIVLGPVEHLWRDPLEYQFLPEDGDEVCFTRHAGMAWWTPLTFSIFGSETAKWKRFIYFKLRWRKKSGHRLEVMWRDEEWWYRKSGWHDQMNIRLAWARIRG